MNKFEQVLEEMRTLQARKRKDYGSDQDPLANIRAGAQFAGVPDWVGSLMRANDKMFRLSAAAKGSPLSNEGVEDSLLDLAVYAVHALTLYRETIPCRHWCAHRMNDDGNIYCEGCGQKTNVTWKEFQEVNNYVSEYRQGYELDED